MESRLRLIASHHCLLHSKGAEHNRNRGILLFVLLLPTLDEIILVPLTAEIVQVNALGWIYRDCMEEHRVFEDLLEHNK